MQQKLKTIHIYIYLVISVALFACKKKYQCECKKDAVVTKTITIKAFTKNKANIECSKQGDNAAYVCWNCETCELKN